MQDESKVKSENSVFSKSEKEILQPLAIVKAAATASVVFEDDGASLLANAGLLHGDVLSEARVAGVQAAKKAHEFIPMPHSRALDHVSVDMSVEENKIEIIAKVRALSRGPLDAWALSAVSASAITLLHAFSKYDPQVAIRDMHVLQLQENRKDIPEPALPIKTAVLIVSDRIVAGLADDDAGTVFRDGLKEAGLDNRHYSIIANDSDKLVEKFQEWLQEGVDLIITCGGNGLGRRDITLNTVEPFFDYHIEGMEQSLYSLAREHNNGLFTQRLAVGKIGQTFVFCLPLDGAMARSTLGILLPNIHKAFVM